MEYTGNLQEVLYNMVHCSTFLDITWYKGGLQRNVLIIQKLYRFI